MNLSRSVFVALVPFALAAGGCAHSPPPRSDYAGGWVDDWHKTNEIAQRQNRYIFVCFTSMDAPSDNFSKRLFDEILDTPEFENYADGRLVMHQADFHWSATHPVQQDDPNAILAQLYHIRGYPTVVVLNPQGKKIADGKYQKGGPTEFVRQLNAAIETDRQRRPS